MKKNKDIQCFTPTQTNRPMVGDIIFGEEEFVIGRKKKEDENIIEVGITEEQCFRDIQINEQIVSKGFLFDVPSTVRRDDSVVDKTRKNATWVVEFVDHKESLQLLHSILPEQYLIRAKRLIDGEITKESETIEFYTCGIFENTINKKFEVIGTMKI